MESPEWIGRTVHLMIETCINAWKVSAWFYSGMANTGSVLNGCQIAHRNMGVRQNEGQPITLRVRRPAIVVASRVPPSFRG